jgi:tRNA pseudouridine38-40 synthase
LSHVPSGYLPLFFNVAYDGSKYSGWQIQKNGISVTQIIESAFQTILRDPLIRVFGASRTDRGVHALGQAACAYISPGVIGDGGLIHESARRILYSLNALLRPEIHIQKIFLPPASFQPRFDSTGKSYVYFLYLDHVSPPFFPWSWAVGGGLDLAKLKAALEILKGRHDFRSFAQKNSVADRDCTRHIYSVRVKERSKLMTIFFRGSGFLHHQIRIMVGTAAQLAKRKDLDINQVRDSMRQIREARERTLAGRTAPAHGLFLHRVYYPIGILRQFRPLAQ